MRGKVLIAGGTGLIGSLLEMRLRNAGYEVFILTRNSKAKNHILWDPERNEIDVKRIESIEVLINLCGAGIADGRWTKKRKRILESSRIGTTNFLFKHSDKMRALKHYISASGITCYGYEEMDRPYSEEDEFGTDYLSQLVMKWEESARQFESICKVSIMRISIVLSGDGGALPKLMKIVKKGLASPIGSGNQWMPWIYIDDLVSVFLSVIDLELEGPLNAVTSCTRNTDFIKLLAKATGNRIWLPKVPVLTMRVVFGEMADMLTKGVQVSNDKMYRANIRPVYNTLEGVFEICK